MRGLVDRGRSDMERIGVADTMFARVDMGAIAERKLAILDGHGDRFQVLRRTVLGMKTWRWRPGD